MKKKLSYILFYIITSILISSCEPELAGPSIKSGEIDPSVYVAVGDDFAAGYMDGALYYEGQKNSFPFIISQQFLLTGEYFFNQPWISENSVGIGNSGKSKSVLGYATDCLGASSLKPVPFASTGDQNALNTNLFPSYGPFNNMGVPDLKMIELSKQGYGNTALGIGNFNPFFARIASDPLITSPADDATILMPTFFSIFAGTNDALAYALKGGASNFISPPNGGVGVGFEGSLNDVISKLKINNGKGVIGTIPDVLDFPYFTTIPIDGLSLDSANASLLNAIYNPMGIYFQIGKNHFTIEDTSEVFGVRQIKPGEYILLNIPLDSVKCFKMGSVYPIPNRYVINENEALQIRNAVSAYNIIINNQAQQNGLAVADIYQFFKNLKSGIVSHGISLNSTFVSGGAFSLDGIHLNPRGNALLANEFLKAINLKFGSNYPIVDPTKFKGIIFP
ncbi:MAG: hypothetical protein ACK452_14210 [Bacteroidota bacterium]